MTRRAVEASVTLEAAPAVALQQFLDLDAMREWWGVARGLIEARPGGVWALAWEPSPLGYKYVETGIVAALRPGERMVIERLLYIHPERGVLGPMQLKIVVEPTPDGRSRVRVRQGGYQQGGHWAWYREAVAAGWPAALKQLRKFVKSAVAEL